MSAPGIAGIVFACCFGAGLAGLFLNRVIPDQHLDSDSKDTVKLVMGLIATMAALVLSLLIASAKSSYEAQETGLEQLATGVIELDRRLAGFGPETENIREAIRVLVVGMHDRVWSADGPATGTLDPKATAQQYDRLLGAIRALPAAAGVQ